MYLFSRNVKLQFMGEAIANESLPPRGRGTAAGFPEANEVSFGGSRDAVEGACGTVRQNSFHRNAFSLSRLRRQLPPGGSLTA